MSALGSISILAGFVGCVMACITLTVGLVRREGALLKLAFRWSALVFGSAIVAALILEIALLRDDFSFQYVEANSNIDLPLLFKIAALWASLEGSLVLWVLVLLFCRSSLRKYSGFQISNFNFSRRVPRCFLGS